MKELVLSIVCLWSFVGWAAPENYNRYWRGVHQGWMDVKSTSLLKKKWKARWCAIGTAGHFYVFKKPDSPVPKFAINLKNLTLKVSEGPVEFHFELCEMQKKVLNVRTLAEAGDLWREKFRSEIARQRN